MHILDHCSHVVSEICKRESLCLGLFRSAFHSVQPIELNFSESPVSGSPSNTIQISMDCITMHEAEEPYTVRE